MKYLVYAILGEELPAEALPPGPCAVAVRLAQAEGLAAAWSAVPDDLARPEVPYLLAYAAVVEALHRRAAVLPVRYGCLLDSEAAVGDLLRLRRETFRAALDRVADCVEMTVRTWGGEGEVPPPREPVPPSLPTSPAAGTAYLARRRAAFADKDGCLHRTVQVGDRLRQGLSDCAVGFLAESPARRAAPPGFHFLVRRADQAAFVEAFRRLAAADPGRLLLTGPWPPYHFADLAAARQEPEGAAEREP
jgi:hypothetical protein